MTQLMTLLEHILFPKEKYILISAFFSTKENRDVYLWDRFYKQSFRIPKRSSLIFQLTKNKNVEDILPVNVRQPISTSECGFSSSSQARFRILALGYGCTPAPLAHSSYSIGTVWEQNPHGQLADHSAWLPTLSKSLAPYLSIQNRKTFKKNYILTFLKSPGYELGECPEFVPSKWHCLDGTGVMVEVDS